MLSSARRRRSTPAEAPERLARHAMAEIARQLARRRERGRPGRAAQRRCFAGSSPTTTIGLRPRLSCRRGSCRDQAALAAGRAGGSTAAAGDAVQPERPAGQRRGTAEHRLRAEGGAGDRRLRRSDLRVRDLDRRPAPPRVAGGRRSPRRSGQSHHDDLHGRDREARRRRAVRARRRDPCRARRADDEAPRQGMAARASERADDRVRRLLEPLAHGAVRRAGVERAAVVDGRCCT